MSTLDKKDDDEYFIPFSNLEKGLVLQEKRMFNETPLNPAKCAALLTRALYLLVNPKDADSQLTTKEATDLFFSVTRLFESNHLNLRRLVYLVLKELLPLAEDVIIVFSCLTKDMNSKNSIYRANAIRVLCALPDSTLLAPAERYLKQAIVDKDPYVSSAALVSGSHLATKAGGFDLVKRWYSEVSNAVKSRNIMVQYHALGLLHSIRKSDRLAIRKLVYEMIRGTIRSPYAHCLLIRYCVQVMRTEGDPNERAKYYDYLESCLHDTSDMVIFEAARGMCTLNLKSKEITPAIAVLQLFLSSPRPTLRFAAIRTLNKVAMKHPIAVTACNIDMENLITDSNRSIATLAITTLLKTGSESRVEHLMKQIVSFMGEISDEFKIVVVDAIAALATKYKKKHRALLNFLSNMLRDEGGYAYKKAIVNTILVIISNQPDSKELGLSHLCEFIEDCEHPQLSIKVLNVLGKEGINTSSPAKYIRYIYNRVNLENENVRASAVSALAKFGLALPHLKESIAVLLKRCLHDKDDEVRDRATYYLKMLTTSEDEGTMRERFDADTADGLNFLQRTKLEVLELSVKKYLTQVSEAPFDMKKDLIEDAHLLPGVGGEEDEEDEEKGLGGDSLDVSGETYQKIIGDEIINNPLVKMRSEAYAGAGFLEKEFSKEKYCKSSKIVELTEAEMEYVVHLVKHVFRGYIIFEFTITNTLEDRILQNLRVSVDRFFGDADFDDAEQKKGQFLDDVNLRYMFSVPVQELKANVPGKTFIFVEFRDYEQGSGNLPPLGNFGEVYMKFDVVEVDAVVPDPDEDEYKLEDIELNVADFMMRQDTEGKSFINAKFAEEYDRLSAESEVVERFSLSAQGLEKANDKLVSFFGLEVMEGSIKVKSKKRHALFVGGFFYEGSSVLCRVRMKMASPAKNETTVVMEVTVRSAHAQICNFIVNSLLG